MVLTDIKVRTTKPSDKPFHFVAIKTVDHQDIKVFRSACQLMVDQRTTLATQAKSLAADSVGIHTFRQRLPDIIGCRAVNFPCTTLVAILFVPKKVPTYYRRFSE